MLSYFSLFLFFQIVFIVVVGKLLLFVLHNSDDFKCLLLKLLFIFNIIGN